MRVLYLHGLEENAQSLKPSELAKDPALTLHVPPLKIFHSEINGILASVVVSLAPVATACFAIALFAFGGSIARSGLAAGLATGAVTAFRYKYFRSRIVSRSLDASFDIARRAVLEQRPDVVVGFSWGGALALRLVEERVYAGPLVLLGSAHVLLSRAAGRKPFDLSTPLPKAIAVIHGAADTLVPVADSLAIADAAGVEVDIIQGEPHKLWAVAPRLAGIVKATAEK
jgi:dienelactone hydrolase